MGSEGDQTCPGHPFPLFDPRQPHGIDLNVRPTPRAFKVHGPTLNRLDHIVLVDPKSRFPLLQSTRRPDPLNCPSDDHLPPHSPLPLPVRGRTTAAGRRRLDRNRERRRPSVRLADSLFFSVSPSERHRKTDGPVRLGAVHRRRTNDDLQQIPVPGGACQNIATML